MTPATRSVTMISPPHIRWVQDSDQIIVIDDQ